MAPYCGYWLASAQKIYGMVVDVEVEVVEVEVEVVEVEVDVELVEVVATEVVDDDVDVDVVVNTTGVVAFTISVPIVVCEIFESGFV